jgi:tripeptidyl-peptidase-1
MIPKGSTVADPETACELVIFSGGGFSNIFPMPDFQAAAVTSFLENHPPPYTAQQFNNSGQVRCLSKLSYSYVIADVRQVRAFPDLSANGANYVIGLYLHRPIECLVNDS